MSATVFYMWMSLDGFIVASTNRLDNGLGDADGRLHESSFNGQMPISDSVFDDFMATGAIVAGRGSIEPGDGWGGHTMTARRFGCSNGGSRGSP